MPQALNGNRRQGVYWLLTIPDHDFEPYFPQECAYIKGQEERGSDTGFLHWQVMVVLRRKGSLSTIQGIFGERIHGELTRSNAANEYVWKEDTRVEGTQFEFGRLPMRRNNPADWDDIWNNAQRGLLEEIPANVRLQHYRTLRTIRADYAIPEAMVRQCFVFCGPTGTGKSRRAWEEAGLSAYPKDPRTKFWDGYRDQEHVVIDEFRGAIDISHMLRWLDRYPCLVEIKGSSTCLVATKIWITSNVHPDQWFPMMDDMTVAALMRRLQITVFE